MAKKESSTGSSLQQAVNVKSSISNNDNFESQFTYGLDFSELENATSSKGGNGSASDLLLKKKKEALERKKNEEQEEIELFRRVSQHQMNASANEAAALFESSLAVTKKISMKKISLSETLSMMHDEDQNGGESEKLQRKLSTQKKKLLTKKQTKKMQNIKKAQRGNSKFKSGSRRQNR